MIIDDKLVALFESFGMTQFVNSPTRGDSPLDVIASEDSFDITRISVNDGSRLSDHQLTVAKLESHRSKQNERYQSHDLKAVDSILFKRGLRKLLSVCPETTVDGSTEQLQRVVTTALDVSSASTQYDLEVAVNKSHRRKTRASSSQASLVVLQERVGSSAELTRLPISQHSNQ